MATIRVICPACRSELEVGDAHEGQEVECGNCLHVFVAERPKPTPAPPKTPARPGRPSDDEGTDDRPRFRRRRDDDDEFAPPPPRSANAGDGLAVAAFVLGAAALPIVCCWPLSIPLGLGAAVTGGLGIKSRNNRTMAVIGLILGIITLEIAGLILLAGFGPALLGR
jgi:hypothetical protein